MSSAIGMCESVNLTPEPTEPAVELIYGVLPLLKTAEGLVQCVELCLTGVTVSALQRLPHLTRSGKICNLRADLKSDSLVYDHLDRGVIGGPFFQLLLEGLEDSGRERRGAISSLQRGAGGIGEVGCNWSNQRAINMAENA